MHRYNNIYNISYKILKGKISYTTTIIDEGLKV
jgi:hypothetical protein